MRVLHVITALGVGGAERMLLKLLGARALAGVAQHVVAMLPGGALAGPMRQTGAPVTVLNFFGGVPLLSGLRQLAAHARRLQPDVLQGWMYHGNLGASWAQRALRPSVPLVWGIRQSLPSLAGENVFARAAIYLGRAASSQPDRLLFNSHTSLQQHQAFGFDTQRALFMPNGFDTAAFAPDATAREQGRARWGVGPGTTVFGLLARHHPAKGHRLFIEAARQLHAAGADVHLVLAGTGVDASNTPLVEALAAAGLRERAQLLGERSDVAAVLSGLDVYVSASTRLEGFSNSVGEAMSCGLPCVVTQVGDSPQVVGDTGITVPAGDAAALATAMGRLLALGPAGRQALGERARQRVQAEYGIEGVAQRYATLYQELLGARAANPPSH